MQDLYGSHTVCVSARPARENVGSELRAMCMDTAGSPTQPYKINADKIYSGEYSFGESIILLRHRRERESYVADLIW